MSELPPPDPDLAAKIAAGSARVEKIEHAGRTLWIKRPEVLRGKLRLYKGDPARAFSAERAAFLAHHTKNLPIAKLVATGVNFIVFEDAGLSLKLLLRHDTHPLADRIAIIESAATALAQLHLAGVSHGRPNLKDIMWQDGTVRFIDLERASAQRNTPRGHAEDVILFFFSAFAEMDDSAVEIEAARKAYIAAGGAPFWELAVRRMAGLGWAYWLTRLAVPFLGRGRDFQAIKPTFAFFKSFKIAS